MIKLQDFARERGVTDRQIQRLLQKYAAELEGLFQRKGPNGTWLSEEACEILRSKMKSNPVSEVVDTREVDELKKKLAEAEKKISDKEKYITALEAGNLRQQERLNFLEGNQLLLEEGQKKIGELEAENSALSHDMNSLKLDKAKAEKEAENAKLEASELASMSIIDFIKYKFTKGRKKDGTEN